jgi:VWFA-related protein
VATDTTSVKYIVALTALTLVASISIGQTLSPGEVQIRTWIYRLPPLLRVPANEVEVGAVVWDNKGHVVNGMKQQDFKVYDDGKEQPISSFAIEKRELRMPSAPAAKPATLPAVQPSLQVPPPRPRYVALYFDDLNTPFGDMRHVQLAAENFIRQGLSVNDKIALFTASGLQTVDFTTDAQGILNAIDSLRFHGRAIKSTGCPLITPYDAYEIATEPHPSMVGGRGGAIVASSTGSPTYETILGEAVKCNCFDEANLDLSCQAQQATLIQAESQQIWDSVRQMSQDTLATLQATIDSLAKAPGERVLVLASSGFLTGTLEIEVDQMVENALRAGVVINALDAKGLYTLTGVVDPNHGYTDTPEDQVALHNLENFGPAMASATGAMVDFAVGTGGRFFHNRNDLTAGYYSLAVTPQTEYLLGFAPESEKLNGHFHKLKIEVTVPGKFYVQARPGYFPPATQRAEKAAIELTSEQKIDAEVRGSEQLDRFPLNVSEGSAGTPGGSRELNVRVRVDVQKLPFQQQSGRYVESLTFVTALFDPQGNIVVGKEAQMDFALKPETFARFSKTGIIGTMSLQAPPGPYRLRTVVEEGVLGEISAVTRDVQMH